MALKYKMKQGKGEQEFCQENALVLAHTSSNNTRDKSTYGHHQMINTEMRLIIFFAVAKMEKLYMVSKNKTGR